MARWNEAKREAARKTLLKEARDLFEAQGFERTTMRQVAKASGVAVGTTFNYFPDKRALLYAALRDDLEEVLADCLTTMPEANLGLEPLLVHCAGRFFDYYCARPALSRTLLKESLWATDAASEAFRDQVTRLAKGIAAQVVAIQSIGELRPDASIEHIVLAFLSHYYFTLLSQLNDTPDPAHMRATIEVLARQLVRGVGAR